MSKRKESGRARRSGDASATLASRLDALTVAVVAISPELTVVHANEAARDLLRQLGADIRARARAFDPADPVGASLATILDPADCERLFPKGGPCVTEEEVTIGERALELRVCAVQGEGGAPGGWLVQAQDVSRLRLLVSQAATIDTTMATIQFEPDGTIISANDNFLKTVRYRLEEVQGKHHRIFCDPEYTKTPAYEEHWRKLRSGESIVGEFARRDSQGNEIWLNATYFSMQDPKGKVFRVMKIASDATAAHQKQLRTMNLAQSIGSGITELSESAREIATNMENSARTASSARERALATREVIDSLQECSTSIGKVVEVISKLAGQSHMLALNATIEAARVGELGRGFAVVAAEVKQLALETSEATGSIGKSVEAIQEGVQKTVQAVHEISDEIGTVTENATSVASAIEEQTTVIHTLAEDSRGLSED